MKRPLLPCLLALNLAFAAHAQATAAKPVEAQFFVMPAPNQQQRQSADMRMTMDMKITPREGASEEERAQIAARSSGAKMPMRMNSRVVHELQSGALDAEGWMPVTLRIRQERTQMRNAAGELMPMPPSPMADLGLMARYSPSQARFEVLQLQGKEADAPMRVMGESVINSMMSSMKPIDGQRFRLGERREFPIDVPMQLPAQMPLNGKVQTTAGYTLTRLAQGVAYFDIDVTLTLQMAGEVPATPASGANAGMAGGPLSVEGSGKGKGSLAFRVADRTPVKSALAMKQSMQFQMPDGNEMRMQMDLTMDSVGENLTRAPMVKRKP